MKNLKDFYYDLKAFKDNLKWMIPAAWNFRCWDYQHNINLFSKSLEVTGNTMIKYGNCINSKKHGRRAIYAAHKLKTAYADYYYNDKSIQYLFKTNPTIRQNNTLKRLYKHSQKDFNKLYEVSFKRVGEIEKNRQKEAWTYLHKYLPFFWD